LFVVVITVGIAVVMVSSCYVSCTEQEIKMKKLEDDVVAKIIEDLLKKLQVRDELHSYNRVNTHAVVARLEQGDVDLVDANLNTPLCISAINHAHSHTQKFHLVEHAILTIP
jgi:hypothetical protein